MSKQLEGCIEHRLHNQETVPRGGQEMGMACDTDDTAVLMIHGLAETTALMAPLASMLRMAGFSPVLFDYPSTSTTIELLTERFLRPAIAGLGGKKRLDIVTHSMGGVMLRYYLQNYRVHNLGRIVMLAPGHAGSPMLSLYCHNPLYRFFVGPAGVQSCAGEGALAWRIPRRVDAELGIIAGCLPLDPLSLFVMKWPHDGRLPVESTWVAGMTDHIVLPASHDMMMINPLACYEVVQFLRTGTFDHGPLSAMKRPSGNYMREGRGGRASSNV
jgi:triacylglycerol lipase